MQTPDDVKADMLDNVLDLIADGESMREACRKLGFNRRTIIGWIDGDAAMQHRYARACEERAVCVAEDSMLEARAAAGMDAAGVAAQRLIVDTLKWHASKLAPKKYGDKIENTIVGDANNPLTITTIERHIVDPVRNIK